MRAVLLLLASASALKPATTLDRRQLGSAVVGAGVGLVSITLAKLGVARVVCTDGEPSLPPLCQAHAAPRWRW